jgi:streptogramin lyase
LKRRTVPFAAALVLLVHSGLAAGWWNWKTHTATLEIRDLCPAGDTLWCATEGGLLAFDPDVVSFRTWTNTEELAANEMGAVARDRTGCLWLGFSNGLLQKWNPADGSRRTIDDYGGHAVTCLWTEGDSLFVGLDIGVSLFLISGNEVKETYRRLGRGIQVETQVNAIRVLDGRLWAATDEGPAWAPLSGVNLLDPDTWSNPALPATQDAVSCMTEWGDGRIALLGPSGLFLQEGVGWERFAEGYPGARPEQAVRFNDALYTATAVGVFRWSESSWERVWTAVTGGLSLSVFRNRLWIGTKDGLWEASADETDPLHHIPDCPVASLMTDMACDSAGALWCATPKGICRYDASGWRRFAFAGRPELPFSDARAVATDSPGRAWFGTWGNGLFRVEGDSLTGVFDVRNGILATSTPVSPNYPCVSDLAFDHNGVLWALNWNAQTYRPLVAAESDSQWSYFGSAQGITAEQLQNVAVGPDNRKWIGTAEAGVMILEDAGTVSEPDDDPDIEWINTSDGLTKNEITAVAVDRDGVAWIGTKEGLYYYSYGTIGQIHRYYQDVITALLVDGVNNVWVGTTIGVGYFSASTYEGGHFSAGGSPLPSDRITSLAWDPESGRVFVGTDRGLSSIGTPFSRPAEKLGSLSVHPNPFCPGRHEALVIEGLSGSVSVSVYTAAGRLVRRFPLGSEYGRRILWDGRNDQGRAVSGGVYLIVAQEEGGRTASAKAAVVR